jgi:hypothetical protein
MYKQELNLKKIKDKEFVKKDINRLKSNLLAKNSHYGQRPAIRFFCFLEQNRAI